MANPSVIRTDGKSEWMKMRGDLSHSADGRTLFREVIMVSGADGQGVTAPDDPRVVQAIEAIVLQGNPLMSRAGEPEKIKSGSRPAVQFTWGSSDIWGHKNQCAC